MTNCSHVNTKVNHWSLLAAYNDMSNVILVQSQVETVMTSSGCSGPILTLGHQTGKGQGHTPIQVYKSLVACVKRKMGPVSALAQSLQVWWWHNYVPIFLLQLKIPKCSHVKVTWQLKCCLFTGAPASVTWQGSTCSTFSTLPVSTASFMNIQSVHASP